MDADELEPRKKAPALKNLEPLGVAELEAYLRELETEIVRTQAEIALKRKRRTGAESIFKR
jgi:uncharacterized small protein (DUF1192 family)